MHLLKRTSLGVRGILGVPGRGGGAPLEAAVTDFITVASDGSVTTLFNNTATTDLNIKDHENTYRTVPAGVVPFEGGRFVENLLTYSEDFSQSDWIKSGVTVTSGKADPDGGSTAAEVECTVANGDLYQYKGSYPAGDYVKSIWMRRVTGTGAVRLNVGYGALQDVSSVLTSSWQRFSHNVTGTPTGNFYPGIELETVGDKVEVAFALWENSTGRSDTTTPSEYVKSEATAGFKTFFTANGNSVASNVVTEAVGRSLGTEYKDELVTNGGFDTDSDWTKGSGWTISGGEAIFNAGANANLFQKDWATTPLQGSKYEITIVVTEVNDAADAINLYFGSEANPTREQVDSIGGAIDAAGTYKFEHTVVNSDIEGVTIRGLAGTGDTKVSSISVKEVEAYPSIFYTPAATNDLTYSRDLTNATWTNTGCAISYDQTGISGEPDTASLVEDDNASAWEYVYKQTTISNDSNTHTAKFFIDKDTDTSRYPSVDIQVSGGTFRRERIVLNTSTGAVTAELNSDGSYEVLDGGNWWVVLVSVANNSSGNTIAQSVIVPSYNTDGTATQDNAATGSIIVGNVELHLNKTIAEVRALPPIFTTTAPASIDRTVLRTDDLSWFSQDKGAFYFEWTPQYATAEVSGDLSILDLANAAGLAYYDGTNGNVESTDGTNTCAKSQTLVSGTKYKVGIAYDTSANKIGISINGSAYTETSYDGSYAATSNLLELFYSHGYVNNLEVLKYTQRAYTAGQSWIDGEMA